MKRVRRALISTRLLLTAVLALCLAVRLLTPAGFMPSFAGGALTIVPCPDAAGALPPPAPPPMATMPHMHGMALAAAAMPAPVHEHDRSNDGFHHQSCPYASLGSLAGIDPGIAGLIVPALLVTLPRPAQALPAFRRHATRDRPPSHGPPLPA